MKNRIKYFMIGFLICFVLMTTTPVLADTILQKIDVILNTVKVDVNGKKLNTNSILYNGTVYIPIRDVSEALEKDVIWDQDTMTVSINNKTDNDIKNIAKYNEFIKKFDLKDDMSAKLNDKTYSYYKFSYNGDLNDDEFNTWISEYSNELNSYFKASYNSLGTYGVLNTIVEFTKASDNGVEYWIGRVINDSEGLIIEVNRK